MPSIKIISYFIFFLVVASQTVGASVITVCSSGCNNSSIQEAINFSSNMDVISLQENLNVENMQIIVNKPITIDGNYYTVSALGRYPIGHQRDESSFILNSGSIKNTTFSISGSGSILWVENMQNQEVPILSNIELKGNPNVVGLRLLNITNATITNLTFSDSKLLIDSSFNVTIDRIKSRNTFDIPRSAMQISSSEGINLKHTNVENYNTVVTLAADANNVTIDEGDFINNKRVFYGKNNGMLNIFNSSFHDNSVDVLLFNNPKYKFTNNSFEAVIILPNSTLDVQTFKLQDVNITIEGKNYTVVLGLNINTDCETGSCTLYLYYNKTLLNISKLNLSSLKIWHVTNATSKEGEWLIPNERNTDKGYVAIIVSTFSDYYLIAEPVIDVPHIPLQNIGNSGSGSSGSGDGGGITSTENFSNILKWEERSGTLIAEQPTPFKFNLPIYEILLISKENEYDVSVRIELLKDKPYKITIKPEGEVIQYFNVITSTKKMKEAVIRFKTNVPTYLLKWNTSEWVKLNMVENVEDIGLKIPSECIDEQQICYTYQTDSFSSFVIIKNEQISLANLSDNKDVLIPIANLNDNKDTPLIIKQSSSFTILMSVIVILIVIIHRKK